MTTNKFIIKLIQMMRQYPQIINWSSDGKEIDILDIQKFSSEVHPKFFTTSNYQSFVRQLNMYSFKKMAKRKNSVSFRHDHFQRDNNEASNKIRRRKQKNSNNQNGKQKETSSLEELHTTYSANIVDNDIRETLTLLRKEVSPSGMSLLVKLEQLLQRSMGSCISSDNRLTQNPSSLCELREFVSLCKIEEQILQKGVFSPSGNSDFNFQSNNMLNTSNYDHFQLYER